MKTELQKSSRRGIGVNSSDVFKGMTRRMKGLLLTSWRAMTHLHGRGEAPSEVRRKRRQSIKIMLMMCVPVRKKASTCLNRRRENQGSINNT
mmetsp:Transcript_14746/g.24023  ORF Transcript_14746/g.24023 Transcript_14746/m.24023 type:complete len:92 (+) Transcript_14746:64-339(+)